MTTAWTSQGPLDDYLQECDEIGSHLMDERPVASGSGHRRGASMGLSVPGQWVDQKERRAVDEWDSFLQTENQSTPLTILPPPPQFPEKFKYLICSSALLDPGLVGVGGLQGVKTEPSSSIQEVLRRLLLAARERLDIVCATMVIWIALCVCIGLMATLGFVATSLGLAWMRPPPLQTTALPNPQSMVLDSLEGLISETSALDRQVASSLELLGAQEDRSSLHYEPLRLHLHRLTVSLTDHFATAYSTLHSLSSPSDLALFQEMYGLPDEGRRRKREPSRKHQTHQSLADDRFTSIPPRTPRLSKRSSWDGRDALRPPFSPAARTLFSPNSLSVPITPSRLAFGSSPSPLLPSAMDKSLGKRSSLQSMPYYPADSDGSEIALADLHRSSSLGRRPKQSKAHQLSPLPLRRTDPHNTMALSALKAAFYGAHLKRQRVACCLLALKFGRRDGPLEELEGARYWLQVRGILESLRNDCKNEREAVEAIEIVEPRLETNTPRHWNPTLGSPVEFAPRLSDEELMVRHMQEMETLLAAAATTLGSVTLDESSLSQWLELRSDLSNLVREWERGKDVLERMAGVPELPPFMKAWSESPQQPSTPVMLTAAPTSPTLLSSPARSDDDVGDHLIDSASPNSLPPPGIDTIFEGFSARSRPQRIKLAPVAKHNGEVVDELRDVIGLIRKRKGVAEEAADEKTPIAQREDRWRPTEHPFVGLGLPPPPRRSDAEAGLIDS